MAAEIHSSMLPGVRLVAGIAILQVMTSARLLRANNTDVGLLQSAGRPYTSLQIWRKITNGGELLGILISPSDGLLAGTFRW